MAEASEYIVLWRAGDEVLQRSSVYLRDERRGKLGQHRVDDGKKKEKN